MCLVRDRNELTPLHLAAIKGRVEVMKVLLKAQPDAARIPVYGGENILYLCVKPYELEALKLLVETVDEPHELVNSQDVDGNTVLHLAVADKQVETIKFLVSVGGIEVNAVNHEGMTAVDVLIRSRRNVRDSEIEKTLKQARGFGTSETNMPALNMNQNMRRWDGQQKIALTFVAILIAITAFQIGVKSASVVWQDDGLASSDLHRAGFSILTEKKIPKGFRRFCIANATSFAASLSIILLLICGLPFIRRFFMWILMVIAKIAITVVVCYVFVIVVVTPNSYQEQTVLFEVVCTVIVWLIFMALLFIRMVVKFVEKLRSPAAPLQQNNIIVV
ncbi:hypothetical protein C2S52_007913 [Perilla frutescens var. hirtella]|nr:hypothetical protein C2S52_007913 [Perilla frutescens var. hirtella]